jgi:hypothetical protein
MSDASNVSSNPTGEVRPRFHKLATKQALGLVRHESILAMDPEVRQRVRGSPPDTVASPGDWRDPAAETGRI